MRRRPWDHQPWVRSYEYAVLEMDQTELPNRFWRLKPESEVLTVKALLPIALLPEIVITSTDRIVPGSGFGGSFNRNQNSRH